MNPAPLARKLHVKMRNVSTTTFNFLRLMNTLKNISIEVKAIAATLILIAVVCAAFTVPSYMEQKKEREKTEQDAKVLLTTCLQLYATVYNAKDRSEFERVLAYKTLKASMPSIENVCYAMRISKYFGEGHETTKNFEKLKELANDLLEEEEPYVKNASEYTIRFVENYWIENGFDRQIESLNTSSQYIIATSFMDYKK